MIGALVQAAQNGDPLTYTLPNNAVVDFFRVVAVLIGGLLFLVSMVRWLQHERFYSAIMGMALGALAAAQELQQIGQDFIPWRLPVLIVGCAAGIKYMYYTVEEIQTGPRH